MFLLRFIVFTLLFFSAVSAHGWGQTGHRVTAEIAQRNLSPQSAQVIRQILGGQTLAEIAPWPDDIRSDDSWDFIGNWHYISIDDDESWDGLQRKAEDQGDIWMALEKLEKLLADPKRQRVILSGRRVSRDGEESLHEKDVGKRELLAFYVHLVGDIHQPLHVGRRDDRGANKIAVNWFGEETNLHKVWDELLIDSTDLSYTEMATFLNRANADTRADWNRGDYLDWAKESRNIRSLVYDFGEQRTPYHLNIANAPVLKWKYRYVALPVVRDRLTRGGIRLAGKLDKIFAGYPDQN